MAPADGALILGLVGVLVVSDWIATGPVAATWVAGAPHAWWLVAIAAAVATQQFAGRRRFYLRREDKVM